MHFFHLVFVFVLCLSFTFQLNLNFKCATICLLRYINKLDGRLPLCKTRILVFISFCLIDGMKTNWIQWVKTTVTTTLKCSSTLEMYHIHNSMCFIGGIKTLDKLGPKMDLIWTAFTATLNVSFRWWDYFAELLKHSSPGCLEDKIWFADNQDAPKSDCPAESFVFVC